MTTKSKDAREIAKELEAEAQRLLGVAKILKGGPFVTYPKTNTTPKRRSRRK
jgi:guanyl-specific ribonuclease Sa